jgi:hypothetical protein
LVSTVVSTMNLDILSFNILTLVNIQTFVALLDVAEVLSAINKDLPPSRVGAPNLHILCLTRVLNVK